MEKAGLSVSISEQNNLFNFRPDEDYLKKARETDKKYSRIYSLEGFGNFNELRGYTLPFYLDAPPEVHEFIFHAGLGEATRFGFGMIDFADRNEKVKLKEISLEKNQESRWA